LVVDVLREHADYRGPQYVELGERIAIGGAKVLDTIQRLAR
jgi:hypothetical protein